MTATSGPVRIQIRLDEDTSGRLNEEAHWASAAAQAKITVSDIIRQGIDLRLAQEPEGDAS